MGTNVKGMFCFICIFFLAKKDVTWRLMFCHVDGSWMKTRLLRKGTGTSLNCKCVAFSLWLWVCIFPMGFYFVLCSNVPGFISCVYPLAFHDFNYCICFILISCIAFYFKSLADGSSLDITCVKLSCVVFSFVFHILVITCYSRVFKFTLNKAMK